MYFQRIVFSSPTSVTNICHQHPSPISVTNIRHQYRSSHFDDLNSLPTVTTIRHRTLLLVRTIKLLLSPTSVTNIRYLIPLDGTLMVLEYLIET